MKHCPRRFLFWTALLSTLLLGLAGRAAEAAGQLHSLWSIQGKSNTVYFLGSIHLMKPDSYPLARPIENAFERSAVVAFETDIAGASDLKVQMDMMTKGMCEPGKTLKDYVPKETYDVFMKQVNELGVPAQMVDGFKPWLAALTLATWELMKGGFDPEQGVDRHFHARAVKAGKTIVALETVEKQMSIFTDMMEKDQEAMLRETVEELKTWRTMLDKIVAAWKTGDAGELKKLVADAMEKYPELNKKLLTDRNLSWLPKIEELLGGNRNAVIIVGAAHLVGKESLLDLLKKRGFTVKQL